MVEHVSPRRLREIYFAEAEAEILAIERAIKLGRLAGASANAGADLVLPIAAELEARADAHDLSVAAHLLASLEHALIETKVGLQFPAI
jgi:hypothetical protein